MPGPGGDGWGKSHGWGDLLLAAPLIWGCTGVDSCFVAATLIATPRGPRPIGSLRVGDSVWSYDPAQGLVERKVEAVHVARVNVICQVEVGGASLRGVTPSHPIYDAAAERYTALRDLGPASRLLVFDDDVSRACPIERIQIREAPELAFEVYNLTVEGPLHNYVADGVLVHNKSPIAPDPEGAGTSGATTAGKAGAGTSSGGSISEGGKSGSGGASGGILGGGSGGSSGGKAGGANLEPGEPCSANCPTGTIQTCFDNCPFGACDEGGFFADEACSTYYPSPISDETIFCAKDQTATYCMTALDKNLWYYVVSCVAGTPTVTKCSGGCGTDDATHTAKCNE